MPAQEIKKLAPEPVQAPYLQHRHTVVREWRSLPIAWLENFERVTDQFAAFGIEFEDAIAVRPSNPRFCLADNAIVVMPCNRRKSLKINFKAAVAQLHLGLMGSAAVSVSALNTQGHCVAIAQTPLPVPVEGDRPYAEQTVTIDTLAATVIRIESKAPLVLTRLAWKRPQAF